MTAPAPEPDKHLTSQPRGTSVYVQVPGQRLPWRFTRIGAVFWKRTDGLARPGDMQDSAGVARLGEIIDPPWKEKRNDSTTRN